MSLRTLLKNRKWNGSIHSKPEEKLSLLKPSNVNMIHCQSVNKSVLDTPDSPITPIGYKIIKTTEISQGQLLKVCSIEDDTQQFIIKQVDKKSCNIMKEASVLRYCSDSKYICKYIDLFDDENRYYLVSENAGGVTLEKWAQIAFEYVKNGKLDVNEYRNKIKRIFSQIVQAMHWLHKDRRICHLGIEMKNIMLLNGQFFHNENGSISIPGNIEIKMCNFSISKELNPENEKIDLHSLGTLLFVLTFGEYPSDSMLSAVEINCLSFHVYVNNIAHCATENMLKLICELLMFDGNKNCDGTKTFNWAKAY